MLLVAVVAHLDLLNTLSVANSVRDVLAVDLNKSRSLDQFGSGKAPIATEALS